MEVVQPKWALHVDLQHLISIKRAEHSRPAKDAVGTRREVAQRMVALAV